MKEFVIDITTTLPQPTPEPLASMVEFLEIPHGTASIPRAAPSHRQTGEMIV
jgi:hypothetical protein